MYQMAFWSLDPSAKKIYYFIHKPLAVLHRLHVQKNIAASFAG